MRRSPATTRAATALAVVLRRTRARAGLTQRAMGAAVGAALWSVTSWERAMYLPHRPRLEDWLHVTRATPEECAEAWACWRAGRARVSAAASRRERSQQPPAVTAGQRFGRVLSVARVAAGWSSAREFGEILGVSARTVGDWERGAKVPPPRRLEAILRAVDADEEEERALRAAWAEAREEAAERRRDSYRRGWVTRRAAA